MSKQKYEDSKSQLILKFYIEYHFWPLSDNKNYHFAELLEAGY